MWAEMIGQAHMTWAEEDKDYIFSCPACGEALDLGGLQFEHSFQLCPTIREDYRTFFTKCGELGSDDLLKSGLRELLQCDKVYRFAMDFVA